MNLSRLTRVKDAENDFVGVQNFTYAELRMAFDEIEQLVGEPPVGYKFYFYSFINGMGDTFIDFDYNELAETLALAPKENMHARLEVFHCNETGEDEASEGYEIIIYNGKIVGVGAID